MKTLEEIKQDYAEKYQYSDWLSFIKAQPDFVIYRSIINEIAIRYATEAIKADREKIKQSHADELPSELFNDLALGLGKDIDNLPIELP